MTNKEAKEKLYMEWQKFLEDNIDYAGISKAYQTAFKALDQEPSNDMVSRGVFEQVMWERDVAIEQLKELGYELGEKIRTTTAGEGGVISYPQVEGVTPTVVSTKTSEQEPCEDAISRQAVLEKAVYTETEEGWWGYTVDVDYIKSLPSVTPQPKTGHWISHHHGCEYECSECHDKQRAKSNYCPNCGTKMIEPQEREVNNG